MAYLPNTERIIGVGRHGKVTGKWRPKPLKEDIEYQQTRADKEGRSLTGRMMMLMFKIWNWKTMIIMQLKKVNRMGVV